jgi:transcriptional regulator with XRE-family HTH domain
VSDIVDDFIAMIIHSDMSEYQLAKQAGISPQSIKNWISGKHRPNIHSMNLVLHVLNQELAIRRERVQHAYERKPNSTPRMAIWMKQP